MPFVKHQQRGCLIDSWSLPGEADFLCLHQGLSTLYHMHPQFLLIFLAILILFSHPMPHTARNQVYLEPPTSPLLTRSHFIVRPQSWASSSQPKPWEGKMPKWVISLFTDHATLRLGLVSSYRLTDSNASFPLPPHPDI